MKIKHANYIIVFTGIILVVAGLAIRGFQKKNDKKNHLAKAPATAAGKTKRANDIENFRATITLKNEVSNARAKSKGLNYAYGVEDFKPSLPANAGERPRARDKVDGLTLTCFDDCRTQILAKRRAVERFERAYGPAETHRGDVRLGKKNVAELKENTRIVGNLYISNLNNVRIPCGFSVSGNIYVRNSKNVRFMGDNLIDGSVFLKGASSIRALPGGVILTGQIFI